MKNILKVVAGAVIALGLTVGTVGVANAAPTKRVVAEAVPVAVEYVKTSPDATVNSFRVSNLTDAARTVVARYESASGAVTQSFVGLDANETVILKFVRDGRGAIITVFYGTVLTTDTSVSAVAR